MEDLDGLDASVIHAVLRDDLGIVQGHGEARREAWAGMRLDSEPTVRIVAACVREVAIYERELRHLVGHPARLVL